MFESAEQVQSIDKAAFKAEEPKLREALLDAQFDLMESKGFAVLVILAGIDGAGKGEALGRLNEWLDQRHVVNQAFDDRNDEERARPRLWRYWLHLPEKGQIGVYLGSWYRDVFARRVLEGETMPGWRRTWRRSIASRPCSPPKTSFSSSCGCTFPSPNRRSAWPGSRRCRAGVGISSNTRCSASIAGWRWRRSKRGSA